MTTGQEDPGMTAGRAPDARSGRWQPFRSLSRAMYRGFVRDRAALFFSLLFPVMFLLLFGSIYKSSSTPKINVVEVGRVTVLARLADRDALAGLQVTGATLEDVFLNLTGREYRA